MAILFLIGMKETVRPIFITQRSRMILFGYKNDTSGPVFRGIISIVEVVFIRESVGDTDGLSIVAPLDKSHRIKVDRQVFLLRYGFQSLIILLTVNFVKVGSRIFDKLVKAWIAHAPVSVPVT